MDNSILKNHPPSPLFCFVSLKIGIDHIRIPIAITHTSSDLSSVFN